MKDLPKISGVICTRNRHKDLAQLLTTILSQNHPPYEIIVIDDSEVNSSKEVVDSFGSQFRSIGCELKYVKGSGDGLTSARNFGVKASTGDAILFLDDDTLLDRNVVGVLAAFLKDRSAALGVQPRILSSLDGPREGVAKKLERSIFSALMLASHKKNQLKIRRSGATVFPTSLSKTISAQRLYGCCCCYRREIFSELGFDTSLKRWGFLEDFDFSYRVYKTHPRSLYVVPHARAIHTLSEKSRLSTKTCIYMETIHWFYVFFKDVFAGSILNLIAFLWALTGRLVTAVGGLVIKRKPKREWWALIYLLGSYATALGNLRNIRMAKLDFFNRSRNA